MSSRPPDQTVQYQAWARPVWTPDHLVSIKMSGWFQAASVPVFLAAALSAAHVPAQNGPVPQPAQAVAAGQGGDDVYLAGTTPTRLTQYQQTTFVSSAALAPTVLADFGWYSPASEPVLEGDPPTAEGWHALPLPRTWDTEHFEWWTPASEPVLEPDRLHPAHPGWASLGRTPSIPVGNLGWWVQASEPVREPPRLTTEAGWWTLGRTPSIPVGNLGWWQPASKPVREPSRLTTEHGWYSAGRDPSTANFNPDGLAWWRQTSEPVRLPVPLEPGLHVIPWAVVAGEPPPLAVVGWFSLPQVPALPLGSLVQEGGSVLPVIRTWDTERLDWFRPTGIPVLPREQPVQVGLSVLPVVRTWASERLDWFRPASEPTRLPVPLEPGLSVVSLTPVLPPAPLVGFGWFRLPAVPVVPPVPPAQVGLSVLPVVRTWASERLEWFRLPVVPALPLEQLTQEGASVLPVLRTWATERLDWHRLTEQPVLESDSLLPAHLGWWAIGRTPSIPIGNLGWFRPAGEPAWEPACLTTELGTWAIGRTPSVPVGNLGWWRQASEPTVLVTPVEPGLSVAPFAATLVSAPLADFGWFRLPAIPVLPVEPLVAEGGFILPVLRTYSFEAIGWLVLTQQPLFDQPPPNTPGQSFHQLLAVIPTAPVIDLLVTGTNVVVTTYSDLSGWTGVARIRFTR